MKQQIALLLTFAGNEVLDIYNMPSMQQGREEKRSLGERMQLFECHAISREKKKSIMGGICSE